MILTEHFDWLEVVRSSTALRLGIDNSLPDLLRPNVRRAAEGMEDVRALLGKAIFIDSWYRCIQLNQALNGALSSDHIQGWAVDFVCPGFGTPQQICHKIFASSIAFNQLIFEGTWVHVSFAPALRRQVLTAHFSGGKVTYTKELEV